MTTIQVTPDTQPPTAAVLANPTGRILSTLALNFNVFVPLAELQSVLPSEFEAIPAPAPYGPALAGISMYYICQQQCAQTAGGVSAPAAGLATYHFARNNALNHRVESLRLAAELSDASFIACHQAILGPNGGRLPDVEAEARIKRGQLRLKFDIEDEEIGLQTRVRAQGRSRSLRAAITPTLLSLRLERSTDCLASPVQRWSVMRNQLSVSITSSNFQIEVRGRGAIPEGRLGLPGSTVTVVLADRPSDLPGSRITTSRSSARLAIIDDRAKRVPSLGGSVLVAPHGLPEFGRVCAVGDPTGAVAHLVQPTRWSS